MELSSPSNGTSAEPRRSDRPGQVPIGLLLRGLLMLVTIIGLVAGLHYYLGVRLVSDPGLAQPWAALGWGVLGLGFASIPGAMGRWCRSPTSIQGLATIAGVRVYTHRGTGYWGPPLRLGPAPEITELTLVSA